MPSIYPGGQQVRIGQRQFAVEWQEVKPASRDKDDLDPDVDLVTKRRCYSARAAARRAARMVVNAGRTAYGTAIVVEEVADWLEGHYFVAEWNTVGEPEYVE